MKEFETYIYGLAVLLCLATGVSCKNDIEMIKALTSESNLPDVTGYDIEMMYTDSGLLKGRIVSPEVLQFSSEQEPYYEFPQGMTAFFFDTAGNETSFIKSKYALWYTKKQLWEGRNEVYGENRVTGEKIETDQIFWNQKDQKIYSDKFTKITKPDGIFIGENGFDARENLTQIKLNGYSGRLTIKDDPTEEEENINQN